MSQNDRPVNRRDVLGGIATGTAVAGGVAGAAKAKDTGYDHELSLSERKTILEPYENEAYARQVFAEKTKGLRERLVEDGHLDSTALHVDNVALHTNPNWDDFGTLAGAVVWNDVRERGEIYFQKRIDAGGYQVKISSNLTGDVSAALILDQSDSLLSYETTSSGAIVTSDEEYCGDGDDCWTGCHLDGDFCDDCCGNWIDPNYRIPYACSDSDGTLIKTTCCCSCCDWTYSCCYNCGDDTKDGSSCLGCC